MMLLNYLFLLILNSIWVKWKSMMSVILSFELLVIIMLFVIYMKMMISMNIFIFMLFIGVMEAIVGLSLLIMMMRLYGSSLMNTFIW